LGILVEWEDDIKKRKQDAINEAEKNNLKKQTEASYKFVVAR